jgi:integrase
MAYDQGKGVTVPALDDVVALHDGAADDFAVAVTLAAGLGLRAAEVAGLTVDRVDFLGRQVAVDRQWHGKLERFAPVNYAASNRTMPHRTECSTSCRSTSSSTVQASMASSSMPTVDR